LGTALLHQGLLEVRLVLFLIATLLSPSVAQEKLQCVTCGSQVSRGYQVDGRVYCPDHYRLALPRCINCKAEIRGDYRIVGVGEQPVCLNCVGNHPCCFLCAAPADMVTGGGTLSDGRPICGFDRKTAVFAPQEAKKLFEQAAKEVQDTLGVALSLKVPIKEVKLVDVPGLVVASQGQYQKATLMSGRVLGLTTLILKSKGKRRWTEPATVHLLSGVPAERMLTVCAHEYAHVWHAENHPNYSATTPEMREGFAEWVAYKVSEHSQRQRQVAVLDYPSEGLYYEGLSKFLQLEKKLGVAGALKHAITANKL
jgi:hypothetical protein